MESINCLAFVVVSTLRCSGRGCLYERAQSASVCLNKAFCAMTADVGAGGCIMSGGLSGDMLVAHQEQTSTIR